MNHFDTAKQIEIAREIRATYVADLFTSFLQLVKQRLYAGLLKQASTTDV